MSEISEVRSGITGDVVQEVVGFERLVFDDQIVKFDPSRLYRIRARIKPTAGPSESLGNLIRVGIEGIASDGKTLVGTDGTQSVEDQYFVAADDIDLDGYSLDSWSEFTGYIKGQGSYVPNATSSANPSAVHQDVAYMQPVVWVNMPDGDGTVIVGEVLLDVIPEDADQVPESVTRKWAGESGATIGSTLGSNLMDPNGNVLTMFTSQYVDVAPTVAGTIQGEVVTCIYRRQRTSPLSAPGLYPVLVGTASGKIYRAASSSIEDLQTFSLVFDLGEASATIYGIDYNAGTSQYYAWTGIGSGSYGRILYTPIVVGHEPGVDWAVLGTCPHTAMDIMSGCFSGTTMVIGTGGGGYGNIYTSTNGSTWTYRLQASALQVYDIRRDVNNTYWLAAARLGGTDRIYRSTNGTTWSASLSTAGTLTGAPMVAHIDARQPSTSLMVVPYRDASDHPAIRVWNGTAWSTMATYPAIYGGSAYLFSWNGTLYAFGDGVDSPFQRRIFDTTGVAAWERRLIWTDWDFNGQYINCGDSILFLDGTTGNIWALSQFQLLLF